MRILETTLEFITCRKDPKENEPEAHDDSVLSACKVLCTWTSKIRVSMPSPWPRDKNLLQPCRLGQVGEGEELADARAMNARKSRFETTSCQRTRRLHVPLPCVSSRNCMCTNYKPSPADTSRRSFGFTSCFFKRSKLVRPLMGRSYFSPVLEIFSQTSWNETECLELYWTIE